MEVDSFVATPSFVWLTALPLGAQICAHFFFFPCPNPYRGKAVKTPYSMNIRLPCEKWKFGRAPPPKTIGKSSMHMYYFLYWYDCCRPVFAVKLKFCRHKSMDSKSHFRVLLVVTNKDHWQPFCQMRAPWALFSRTQWCKFQVGTSCCCGWNRVGRWRDVSWGGGLVLACVFCSLQINKQKTKRVPRFHRAYIVLVWTEASMVKYGQAEKPYLHLFVRSKKHQNLFFYTNCTLAQT